MNAAIPFPNWLARRHQALLAQMDNKDAGPLRLCFSVLTLAASIDADCAARLAPHGLSEGRFLVLFLLHEAKDGMAPHTLAAQCGVTRATMTGLLDGLEKGGWIERVPQKDDRRRVIAHLSRGGRSRTAQVLLEHLRWMSDLFADIQVSEQQQLVCGLHALWQRTDAGRAAAAGDRGNSDATGW